MQFTLRARWLLPVDGPPLAGGYVGIVNGRIAAVGESDPDLGPVTDLGDVILMPGLVNAHTHLEFSRLSKPLGTQGISLPEWIRLVLAERKRSDADAKAAIVAGLRESVASGVTTVGEIATSPAAFYAAAVRPAAVLFQEAIGFSAGRINSVFADIERRLEEAPLRAGLSPHAPYTVHPQLLERIVRLASARGLPVGMHLAESQEELQLLNRGDGPFRDLLQERSMWDAQAIPAGSRPLDYLRLLAEAPRSLVIHGNYLAVDEIEFLAAHRQQMSVIFCPRTHAWFGHDPYPLEAMLCAGVRVALGTDSRASSPDLSLLNELRAVANRFPAIAPADLVQMATLDGAAALGLAEHVGSLAPGKQADLIALQCRPESLNPYEALLDPYGSPDGVRK
jgi:aminodeoxyfutalosine deaminase